MKFQIVGSDGIPVTLMELDVQAAGFWGQEIESEYYAQPKSNSLGNWFDNIGWGIVVHPHKGWGKNEWKSVKQQMLEVHTYSFVEYTPEEAGVKMCQLFRALKPYYDLIDHWAAMGYKPEQL